MALLESARQHHVWVFFMLENLNSNVCVHAFYVFVNRIHYISILIFQVNQVNTLRKS